MQVIAATLAEFSCLARNKVEPVIASKDSGWLSSGTKPSMHSTGQIPLEIVLFRFFVESLFFAEVETMV